ncbi:MAG: translation initiation factor IF-2 N-terminal domain-containing protein, partial [Phascolarctobacterium sp.]|nr:translation initiation factor IF-2 N-terminal domain-containing protein [Phascolarctobacterium sp.]
MNLLLIIWSGGGLMGNKRIYEVAKDYGKPVNEVIDLLKKNNIEKT